MSNNPVDNANKMIQIILDLNNSAIKLILEEKIEEALEILKDADKKAKNINLLNESKIKVIINHNLAC